MAIAVPTALDEGVLQRQVEAFMARAQRLRAEARDLDQQAIDLKLQLQRQNREPVQIRRQRVAPERDGRLLALIPDALEQLGPCTSTVLATHLKLPKTRVYHALVHLEAARVVKRSGIRRGTVWGLAEDEDLSGHHAAASAVTLVREAGQKLDTFDIDALDAEIPALTRAGIQRACRQLVAEGTFSEARDGRRKIYAWEKPTGPNAPRPKQAPPEAAVVEFARKGGVPVAGTGKQLRSGSPIVDELLRELRDWPIVEIVKRKHKFSFLIYGKEVAHCSTTPGASALGETRRHLNRAGIAVAT